MKELKDYLHLYLGCEVELNNGGSKVYNRKLVAVGGVDDELYCKLRLGKAGKGQLVHGIFLKEGRVKPLLRPLSDMTEEEMRGWALIAAPRENMTDDYIKKSHEDFLKQVSKKGLDAFEVNSGEFHLAFELTHYLLSLHFDLFGLIESGLAIDKTKLQ